MCLLITFVFWLVRKNQVSLRELVAAHSKAVLGDSRPTADGRFPLLVKFIEAADDVGPGFDLMLDYVHPTRRGNGLIARLAYEAIVRNDLLQSGESIELPFLPIAGAYRDHADASIQNTMMWVYGLMHQYESLVAKADYVKQHPGLKLPIAERVLSVFTEKLEVERMELFGEWIEPSRVEKLNREIEVYYHENYPQAEGVAPQ